MTQLDRLLVGALVGAIVFHALVARYDWRLAGDPGGIQQLIRVDRLTGGAAVVIPQGPQSPSD